MIDRAREAFEASFTFGPLKERMKAGNYRQPSTQCEWEGFQKGVAYQPECPYPHGHPLHREVFMALDCYTGSDTFEDGVRGLIAELKEYKQMMRDAERGAEAFNAVIGQLRKELEAARGLIFQLNAERSSLDTVCKMQVSAISNGVRGSDQLRERVAELERQLIEFEWFKLNNELLAAELAALKSESEKVCFYRKLDSYRYDCECGGGFSVEDSRDGAPCYCGSCGGSVEVLSPFHDGKEWKPAPSFEEGRAILAARLNRSKT